MKKKSEERTNPNQSSGRWSSRAELLAKSRNTIATISKADLAEADPEYAAYLARLDADTLGRIERKTARLSTGQETSGAVICMGPEKCPFIEYCPIPSYVGGKRVLGSHESYPIGQQCVMEKLFLMKRQKDLLMALNIDPNDPIELPIAQELALIDLYKNRAEIFLARGDRDGDGVDFMKVDLGQFDENGNQARSTKLHPLLDLMDRLEKRRERWLDRLLVTRSAKSKSIGQEALTDLTQVVSQLKGLLQGSTEDAVEVEV